jgi:hypothetical protein
MTVEEWELGAAADRVWAKRQAHAHSFAKNLVTRARGKDGRFLSKGATQAQQSKAEAREGKDNL